MRYFSLHVFYSRNDGFSVPVSIDIKAEDGSYSDEEIISHAVINGILDSEDANHVDLVDEIDEEEYKLMLV